MSSLAVAARRQLLQAIDRVGNILRGVSGDGARHFPSHFSDGTVIAATDLLDLVEHPDFSNEESALRLLESRFGPSVFQQIFKSSIFDSSTRLSDATGAMDVTPTPAAVEGAQSPTPPPAKRARSSIVNQPVASSSRLAPPPFALPEPMTTRTTSQGEASTSSHPSSRGGARSVSSKRKRQSRS
jgi:hypothetical protein